MAIKEIYSQLETSENPVAKAIHKSADFKVLAIGFKTGMKMKDHQAHQPTKLTVLRGEVLYRESGREITLGEFDVVDIPVEVTHSVEALQDSLCLLTQG